MNGLKSSLLVAMFSASVAMPAVAHEAPPAALPRLSAADAQQVFEQDAKPMQLAALTPQEMKEIAGASILILARWAARPSDPPLYFIPNGPYRPNLANASGVPVFSQGGNYQSTIGNW